MGTAVTEQTISKDFDDLMEKIRSDHFDGQVNVTKDYDKSMASFEVTISPKDGDYNEGEFVFEIAMECNSPLQIRCKTAIYHPNIDTITDFNGTVDCSNLTQESSMQDCVQELLDLMKSPKFANPLCKTVFFSDMAEYIKVVKTSISGGDVFNYLFPMNPRYARLYPANAEVDDEAEAVLVQEKEGYYIVARNFGIKEYMPGSFYDDDDDNHDDDDDDDVW